MSFLLIREDSDLNEEERGLVSKLEQGCTCLAVARSLVLRFARGLQERKSDVLEVWLLEAKASKIKVVEDFVAGLERELAAIKAAFSLAWSKRSRPSAPQARQVLV